MSDEIKEMNLSEMLFNRDERLLDYITNLQEEINKLTAESTEWESKYYDLQKENKRLKESMLEKQFPDLNAVRVQIKTEKYRIEKAIKYIKEKYEYVLGDMTFLDHDELVDRKQITHILNILGGDKE